MLPVAADDSMVCHQLADMEAEMRQPTHHLEESSIHRLEDRSRSTSPRTPRRVSFAARELQNYYVSERPGRLFEIQQHQLSQNGQQQQQRQFYDQRNQDNRSISDQQNTRRNPCKMCGWLYHRFNRCAAFGKRCFSCGGPHLARICDSGGPPQRQFHESL